MRRIGDDERRHMAWGTFTCRRHVAADDANWAVFEARMNELIPLALRNTDDGFALYDDDSVRPDEGRVQQYAADKGMRRFGTISSATGSAARRDRHRLLAAAARGHVRRRGRKGAGGHRLAGRSKRRGPLLGRRWRGGTGGHLSSRSRVRGDRAEPACLVATSATSVWTSPVPLG